VRLYVLTLLISWSAAQAASYAPQAEPLQSLKSSALASLGGEFVLKNPGEAPGNDGEVDGLFGYAIAVSGDTAVIGSRGVAHVYVQQANGWRWQAKLKSPDAGPGNSGTRLAISGNTIVLGAPQARTPFSNQGAVDVYTRSGEVWTQQARLTQNENQVSRAFGSAVAIESDTLVVGAPLDDHQNSGTAIVFQRVNNSWTQVAVLTPPKGVSARGFGRAVTLAGNIIAVGAPEAATLGAATGSAFVFARSAQTWQLNTQLIAGDGANGDLFGSAIHATADSIVVGAYGASAAALADAGAVYSFQNNGSTWVQAAKLVAPDASASGWFGFSLDMQNNTLLVGATDLNSAGKAYVFERQASGWSQPASLSAPDGQILDQFGSAVALLGDVAMVGAFGDNTEAGRDAGSAYVFNRSQNQWTQQDKLFRSDSPAFDQFGSAVDVDGAFAIVGAPGEDAESTGEGMAYIFARSQTTWEKAAELRPDVEPALRRFGGAVAIDGNTAVVGCDDNSDLNVAVYVFVRGTNGAWTQQAILMPPGSVVDFGRSVAIDQDTIVVGAAESAYVFQRMGTLWTLQRQLNAVFGDLGFSVAISGDTIMIGAPNEARQGSDAAGAVHVLKRVGTAWINQSKILPDVLLTSGRFGHSIAIDAGLAVIGSRAPNSTFNQFELAAYLFRESAAGWRQTAWLRPSEIEPTFVNRHAIATLGGNTIAIGIANHDGVFENTGAVYLFQKTNGGWSERLVRPRLAKANDYLGISVALTEQTLLSGMHLRQDETEELEQVGAALIVEDLGLFSSGFEDFAASEQ
jgi:hypothetical protein